MKVSAPAVRTPTLMTTPKAKPAVAEGKLLDASRRLDAFDPAGSLKAGPALDDRAPGSAPAAAAATGPDLVSAVNRHLAAAGLPPMAGTARGALADGAPPDPFGAPAGSAAPDPLAALPGFSTVDLTQFKTAQEARGALVSAEHEVKSESTDVQGADGSQHIKESATHKEADGTVHQDTQTHDSDGKGNSTETQEIIRTHPDGSQEGHRSTTTTTADGKTTTKSEEWKKPASNSTPVPDGEDRPRLTDAEVKAGLERRRAGVADPVDPQSAKRNPADLERLARGIAISKQAKVNPRPDGGPEVGGTPRPRPTPSDPPDENPVTRTPPARPTGGKPGAGPRGGIVG